jgi:hypothetical protein
MREGRLDRTDGLAPLTGDQRRDLLEVIDDRHQRRLQSERVIAFNRNPRRQSSESAGDLTVKASRPRATGKKDGRKTLTLNRRSVARPCAAMSRASASAYHHSIDLHVRFSGQGFRCLATSLRRLAVSDPVLAPSSIFNLLICIERNGLSRTVRIQQ